MTLCVLFTGGVWILPFDVSANHNTHSPNAGVPTDEGQLAQEDEGLPDGPRSPNTGDDDEGGGGGESDGGEGDSGATGGDEGGGGEGEGGSGSVSASPESIAFENPLSASSIPELVASLVRGVLGLLATAALIIIIYAGLKYMTTLDNPSEAKKNIKIITNAVIGLIIIMGAFFIVQYVISALVS
ncbi:MAG: hypothetical protein BRC23_02515 [Parcubacteria group bacterium SW_4_49_11]|nr:MAG: hypothetical protein BRC23_02515 [Parcubacteria group bacterium SW_4_49_11]